MTERKERRNEEKEREKERGRGEEKERDTREEREKGREKGQTRRGGERDPCCLPSSVHDDIKDIDQACQDETPL